MTLAVDYSPLVKFFGFSSSHDQMACSTPRPSPIHKPAKAAPLKRSRTDSDSTDQTSLTAANLKRIKIDKSKCTPATAGATATTAPNVASSPPTVPGVSSSSLATDQTRSFNNGPFNKSTENNSTSQESTASISKMEQRPPLFDAQQKIEAHINLEILLKHKELRLIDQELAKAQIMLEQLRRCRLVPYPALQSGNPASVDQLVDGTGAALAPKPGFTRPSHPAPWGVTDGPYTQHYAKWLLPDPMFDSEPEGLPSARNFLLGKGACLHDARGLRNERLPSTASRRQRQSLGSTTPIGLPARDRATQMCELVRPDGVRVKLVCSHCGKENVNSVQGFLNHCRIAHSDSMTSHAQAAERHGVPLTEAEMNRLGAAPVSTPTTAVAEPMSAVSQSFPIARGAVNPLVLGPRPLQPVSTRPPSTPVRSNTTPAKAASNSSQPIADAHLKNNKQAFMPSTSMPSLSALAQKRGYGVNLAKLVTSASERIDLNAIEPLIPDEEADEEAKVTPMPTGASRLPARGPIANASSHDVTPTDGRMPHTANTFSSDGEGHDFSPRTMETNPGLVSDREDDFEEDSVGPLSERGSVHGGHHGSGGGVRSGAGRVSIRNEESVSDNDADDDMLAAVESGNGCKMLSSDEPGANPAPRSVAIPASRAGGAKDVLKAKAPMRIEKKSAQHHQQPSTPGKPASATTNSAGNPKRRRGRPSKKAGGH